MYYFCNGLLNQKNSRLVVFSCLLLLLLGTNAYAKQSQEIPAYNQAAETLVGFWNQRAYEEFSGMMNVSAISRRVLKGLGFSEKQKLEFTKGFKAGMRKSVDKIINQVPETRYVKLLKTTPMENGIKALVRVDYGDSGLSYLEFYLKKTTSSTVKVVDWYDYAQGQKFSETVRQLLVMRMPASSMVDRIFNIMDGKEAVRQQLIKVMKSIQENKPDEFEKIYQTLGKEARENKMLMILAVKMAILSQDDKFYRQVLNDLNKYHGTDTTVTFLLIDHLFYQKQYDAAVQAIERFQNDLGIEDAGLMSLKSNMLTLKGYPEKGARLAEKAIEKEPEFEDSYWSLFFSLASSEKHEQAVKVAAVLEDRFGYELNSASLAENEAYNGLRQSQVFKQWRAGRNK